MENKQMIVMLGPTASGKTRLAVQLAKELNGEIISADSRQVYRDMNIGTGKDLEEYELDGIKIPYHLINNCAAGEKYNIHQFQQDFYNAYRSIIENEKTPILCGGTGLYISSILQNYQYTSIPVNESLRISLLDKSREDLLILFDQLNSSFKQLADTSTNKRLIRAIEIGRYLNENPIEFSEKPIINAIVVGIEISPELRRKRITDRLHARLNAGMIEEVRQLLAKGVDQETLVYYGLEYKFIVQYLRNEFSLEEMTQRLETAIHQFAKRQMTYFRKMEKDGIEINWINGELPLKEQLRAVKWFMVHS